MGGKSAVPDLELAATFGMRAGRPDTRSRPDLPVRELPYAITLAELLGF